MLRLFGQHRKTRSLALITALCLLLGTLLPVFMATAAEDPLYYPPHLQVESQTGLVDAEVAVSVNLLNPARTAGYSFTLNYDPAFIAPVLVEPGKPQVEPGDLGGSLEANTGSEQLYIAAAGAQPASSDSLHLCTLYFRLLREGSSDLEPTEVEIYDQNGQEISGVTMASGNVQAVYPLLSAPEAVPAPGSFSSVQRVSLKSSNAEEFIYYTLDNSDPSDPNNHSRQLYSSPILVNRNLTVKAVTFRQGRYGESTCFSYTIELAAISGRVTYRGQPLGGTPIKLKKAGIVLNTVSTDAAGDYAFPALADGVYVVIAGGGGGFNRVESPVITLDSQNRQKIQDFQLYKGGSIRGLVKVPEGYDPAGIAVFAQSDTSTAYAASLTETDGSFWLEGLEAVADYSVFTRNNLNLEDAAVAVDLSSSILPVDIQLELTAGQQACLTGVAGEVIEQVYQQYQMTPIAGLWVSLYSPSTNCWGAAETNASGLYNIENLTPAGDYLISYYKWQDSISGSLEGSQVLLNGENIIDIPIPQGLQITGSVKRDDGSGLLSPVAGVNVRVSGPVWGSAITDEQGNYTIKHLSAGSYSIEVDLGNSFDVDSRQQKTITINNENPSFSHDIILIPGGTISGKVVTNPAGGQQAVRITASSAGKNVCRRATTDKNGNFTLRGITPADDYVLDAWKWPYNPEQRSNIEVVIDGEPPVVDFVLNHPDLQAAYFKAENNRYLAMDPFVAPGKVVSFKMDYKNCNPSQTAAGASAEFILPSGLELIVDSVTLNGAASAYTSRAEGDKSVLAVNLGDVAAGRKGTIIFQTRHDPEAGTSNLTSQASIKWADQNEVVGSAQVEVVSVNINGPPFTKPGSFTVYGKCADSALVKVMGKKEGGADLLLGQARAEGKWWNTSVKIATEGNYQLYAVAEKDGVVSDPSCPISVEIKDNTAVLDDVTINAGWNRNVKFNSKIGVPAIAVSQGYSVYVDAQFSQPVDSSSGSPQLLFAINDENINLSEASPEDFLVTGSMSSNQPAGQQKTWNGSFYIDYTLAGDLKAYIYYRSEGAWHLAPVVQIAILIDPSGTITDAHTGQPVPGVRAECEYETDDNGWQHWRAENFGQVNPQFTDDEGHYGWDVPAGKYRVRFTHADYNPMISEVVNVPPPKTDLDLGLTSLAAGETPGVKSRNPEPGDIDVALDSEIMVEFTKDMQSDSVNTGNFIVQSGGTPVEGAIANEGLRRYTFTPASALQAGATYTVQLSTDIKDVFDKPIESAEWTFTTISAANIVIDIAPQLTTYARSTATRPVNVSFSGHITAQELPQSLDLQIADQENPDNTIATINTTVETDGSFHASWPIPTGLAEGVYLIKAWYDGQRWGNNSFEVIDIQAPAADQPDGSIFDTRPLQVMLSCATAEAEIYYTLDGSVPDPTKPEQRYSEIISLQHSGTIRAIAVKKGAASEIVNFSYKRTDECFIATAAFGSKFEPAVVILRQFRDRCLLSNRWGRIFVEFYYGNSPPLAHYIADRPALKTLLCGILTPVAGLAYMALHPQTAIPALGMVFLLLLPISMQQRRKLL